MFAEVWYKREICNSAAVLCLTAQSCSALCDPMDCSPPGTSVHGDSPGKNTGVGCHALFQGIFPTQGLNPLQKDSSPSEKPGKLKNTGVGSPSLLQGIFPIQELNWGLLCCWRILYQQSELPRKPGWNVESGIPVNFTT